VVAALLLAPFTATAGNGFNFPAGSRAAAMAGAYSALADDPATAWWNPAGLGWAERSSLNLSASAYHIQFLQIPEFIRTTMPDGPHSSGLSASPFQVVASSASYVWKIGGWKKEVPDAGEDKANPAEDRAAPANAGLQHSLAFSVFIPASEKFSQSAVFDWQGSGSYHQRFSLAYQQITYCIGPSWGMRINDKVSVGASLFGVYSSGDGRLTLAANANVLQVDGSSVPNFYTINTDLASTELGFAVHLGVQVHPISGLRLGLAVRLPTLRVWGKTSGSKLQTSSTPFFDDPEVREASSVAFNQPFSMTLGVAWQQPGKFAIALDADYTTRWSSGGTRTRDYFNGRLGVEVFVDPRWILGFGGFTDVSPNPPLGSPPNLLDSRMDYFGGTFGITYLSPYLVVGSSNTDRITFATTLGLKYAYGFGKIAGMDVDYTTGAVTAPKDIRSHEVSVLLGSGVRF
jgi:long-chain fatty acid transport protein